MEKLCSCHLVLFSLCNSERRKRRKNMSLLGFTQLRSNGQMQKLGVTFHKPDCPGSHCVCLNRWLAVLKLMHTRMHTIDSINATISASS